MCVCKQRCAWKRCEIEWFIDGHPQESGWILSPLDDLLPCYIFVKLIYLIHLCTPYIFETEFAPPSPIFCIQLWYMVYWRPELTG